MKKIGLLVSFVMIATSSFSRSRGGEEAAWVALEDAMVSYMASGQWASDRQHVASELKRIEVSDPKAQARIEAIFAQLIGILNKNTGLSKGASSDILRALREGQITSIVSASGFFVRSLLFKTAFSTQAVKYLKEEELVAVVAHELGHLVRLDMKRIQLAEINGLRGVEQQVELEADVFALCLLQASGQDPAALLRVLERFQRDKLDQDPVALAARIAAVREALEMGPLKMFEKG